MSSDVKWIKIVTDIFDDEKILLIESMPEADGIIVIWFKLLCLAGKTNTMGVLMMNDRIPYNDEMLSHIFRRPLNTVRLALATFEKYGMIEIVNNTITIPNWGKHQQMDALEKKREYQRNLMAKRRAEQKKLAEQEKLLAACDANSDTNVSRLEEDRDIDITTTPTPSSSNSFEIDPEEMQRITEDHNDILNAAESAGFPKNQATFDKIIDLYSDYGKEAVLNGISACVDQGNTKISYLKAILRRMANGEQQEEADPLLPKDHEFLGW